MKETTEKFEVVKSEEEWRRILTPEQYHVLREHGTERAGTCALLHEHRTGTFSCAACGQPLFVADRKFESGTGWPSFFAPLEGAIGTSTDRQLLHDADRSALQPVRRPPWSRVSRRAAADRPALLHQRRRAELHAVRVNQSPARR